MSRYVILAAKARAAMYGRAVPDLEDSHAIALRVLGHRVLNFQAEAERIRPERMIAIDKRP